MGLHIFYFRYAGNKTGSNQLCARSATYIPRRHVYPMTVEAVPLSMLGYQTCLHAGRLNKNRVPYMKQIHLPVAHR